MGAWFFSEELRRLVGNVFDLSHPSLLKVTLVLLLVNNYSPVSQFEVTFFREEDTFRLHAQVLSIVHISPREGLRYLQDQLDEVCFREPCLGLPRE